MKLPIVNSFFSSCWAILPAKLEEMRRDGIDLSPARIDAIRQARSIRQESLLTTIRSAAPGARRRPGDDAIIAGRIAIVPVLGILWQRLSSFGVAAGGVSADAIGATLNQLTHDPELDSIVLVFDSPGGSVAGVPALSSQIYQARQQKKVVGLADSMAASAAYWLGAQCAEFFVSPGGLVGSVGVIASHDDCSKALELAGIKTTMLTSSKYKGEGSPDFPLSPEAKADLQSQVDKYHAMFIADLARGRGIPASTVSTNFGQGRVKIADDAVRSQMADGISTLPQILNSLAAGGKGRPAAARSAQSAAISQRPVDQVDALVRSARDVAEARARAIRSAR